MKRRQPYRQRVPLPDLVTWAGVFVFLAFFGALYASVRNGQILTGTEARQLEIRIDKLEQQIAGLELIREQMLEPAALERRLRRIGSQLRPIDPNQLVALPLDPPADPLLALTLSGGGFNDELPESKRGGWSLLPKTPVLEVTRQRWSPDPVEAQRVLGAGLMLESTVLGGPMPQAEAGSSAQPSAGVPPP